MVPNAVRIKFDDCPSAVEMAEFVLACLSRVDALDCRVLVSAGVDYPPVMFAYLSF